MRVRRQICIATGIGIGMLAIIAAWVSPALCDAIHNAALAGDLAKVKALVKVNSSLVFSQDTRNGTPLHFAVEHNHLDVAQFLLSHNADVNAVDLGGWTPLHWAAFQGYKDAAVLLLANNANVNAKDNNGRSPLRLAAAHDQASMVAVLLKHRADVNAKDNRGYTPLRSAEAEGYSVIAKRLRQHGGRE